MAAGEFPLWAAIRTIKEGLSGRAGLAAYRSGGGSIRDATWFRLIGEARRSLSDAIAEVTRPLSRRPAGTEVTRMTTRTATGFIQQVDIFVRDRATGLIESRPHSIRTDVLLTRRAAVRDAVGLFQDAIDTNPDVYDEEVLGAAYVGTYELIPEG